MAESVRIRAMEVGEEEAVCALVARVFDRFVASDFSPEGVEEFYRYAEVQTLAQRLRAGGQVLVADEDERLLGMLELRGFEHIAMFFVEDLGRGIGRALLEEVLRLARDARPGLGELTVHASRYAVPIYRKFGFEELGPERTVNGITYLPMRLRLQAAG